MLESASVAAEGSSPDDVGKTYMSPETPGMVKNTDFSQDGQQNNQETSGVGSLSAMELQNPGVASGSPAAAAPDPPLEATGQASGTEASPIAAAALASPVAVASGSEGAAAATEVCT